MLFINGRPFSGEDHQSLALSIFGDGVFETMLFHAGNIHLYEYHLRRLQRGAEKLGLVYSAEQLRAELDTFITSYHLQRKTARLRLVLARPFSLSGYTTSQDDAVRVLSAVACELPDFSAVSVNVAPVVLAHQPLLSGIKHCNRLENILARQQLSGTGFDDSILLDSEGHIIECIAANLFLVSGKRLITPRLENCGVAGVMREFLISEIAPVMGLSVTETQVSLSDLLSADELFLTNAITGAVAVKKLASEKGETRWSSYHVSFQIQQKILHSMQGLPADV